MQYDYAVYSSVYLFSHLVMYLWTWSTSMFVTKRSLVSASTQSWCIRFFYSFGFGFYFSNSNAACITFVRARTIISHRTLSSSHEIMQHVVGICEILKIQKRNWTIVTGVTVLCDFYLSGFTMIWKVFFFHCKNYGAIAMIRASHMKKKTYIPPNI